MILSIQTDRSWQAFWSGSPDWQVLASILIRVSRLTDLGKHSDQGLQTDRSWQAFWSGSPVVVSDCRQLSKTCSHSRKSATIDWKFSLSIVRMPFSKCFPENQFGRPHFGWEYRMFSAYLPKTVESTSGNKNSFLAKDAACHCWFWFWFWLFWLV